MSPHDELTIDVSQIAPIELELEPARAHDLVGPYGALVATMAPPQMAPRPWAAEQHARAAWRSPAPRWAHQDKLDRITDALAVIPMGVWKRVALYSFLFLVFGNLLRCSGLSSMTNISCALLVLIGLAGVGACAQRE
jgi:hypothetical protein